MPFDIFISYAHQGDNTSRDVVTAFVSSLYNELDLNFRRQFDRDLEIFFDKENIRDYDHWQVRCHRALRDSRFFIACLSRTYLQSDACRWEWEEWCRHELAHGLIGQGAASLWFVRLEELEAPGDTELLRRWKGDLLQRFHIECQEWRQDEPGAFLEEAARAELSRLTEHVAQRLRNLVAERARRGNLPWPNDNFVGREYEMNLIHGALLDERPLIPVGLHGVGGMGKTALALAFSEYESEAFPGGCWLLHSEGQEELLTVFYSLVPDLDIQLTAEEKLDKTAAVRHVFEFLRQRGTTLFLLDNLDNIDLLVHPQLEFLRYEPWVRLLYTTRLAPAAFEKAGAVTRSIYLDQLPEHQGVELIRLYQAGQVFASEMDKVAAKEIVKLLSGLTLAVETAAVYLGQSNPRLAEPKFAVSIPSYVQTLTADLKHKGNDRVISQLREVTATLKPTLARLDSATRTVLQLSSFAGPEAVALPWLRAIAGQQFPELATDAKIGQSDPWTQLVRNLVGMRLFQPTPEPHTVTIHRILHRVLETELSENRYVLLANLGAHIRSRLTYLEETTQWEKDRWELVSLEALALLWADQNHPQASALMNTVSCRWIALAEWNRAESLTRSALSIDENNFGKNHPNVAATLNNLAQAMEVNGRHADAEPLYRRALAIWKLTIGPVHPNIAKVLNNIGAVLARSHRWDQAELYYSEALKMDEAIYGPDHPEVARELGNIASMISDQGRYQDAEPLYRRALGIYEQTFGPKHPQVARTLGNLADVFLRLGRNKEAEQMLRRSITINEKTFGPFHPNLAVDLNDLSVIIEAQGKHVKAEELMRRALAIDEKITGESSPAAVRKMTNLAVSLIKSEQYSEAESLLRKAVLIIEQSHGQKHPDLAQPLFNLFQVVRNTGISDEAETLASRALSICMESLGESHPTTVSIARDIAIFLIETGQSTKIPTILGPLVTLIKSNPDLKNSDLRELFLMLGRGHLASQDNENAVMILRILFEGSERTYGLDDEISLVSGSLLAMALVSKGDVENAKSLCLKILAAQEKTLGPDHEGTLQTAAALLGVVIKENDMQAAMELMSRFPDMRDMLIKTLYNES